jgi:hypothetical protein
MRNGKKATRTAATLGLCLGVLGCMSLPNAMPSWSYNVHVPGPDSTATAAPELRLRDEVPLVPLPLPPLNSCRNRPTPTSGSSPSIATTPSSSTPSTSAAPDETQVVPTSLQTPLKTTPTSTPAPVDPNDVRKLYRSAMDKYTPVDSYIVRLTRREVVNGQKKPEEIMLFKFRKQPWSVYFKWLGENGRGREVVFVKGRYEGKLHTLLASGDMPFVPAGKRFSISPDSPFVRAASRHPITEAGLGASIERLGAVLDAQDRGDRRRGTLTALGMVTRPEFARPLPMVEHTVPAGAEAELPGGGKRLYGFDPETYMPVLVVTTDNRGQEVEYYRYDRLQLSVRLDDDDFNPDKLWPLSGSKP